MNETLKRGISGAVYIVLLLVSILYSTETFFILFGIFLLIAIYEFCNLVHLKKSFPLLTGFLIYTSVTLISSYNIITTETINRIFNVNIEISLNIQQLNIILLVISHYIVFYFILNFYGINEFNFGFYFLSLTLKLILLLRTLCG